MDEIEKELDEFLARDDGFEKIDWHNLVGQFEKPIAEGYCKTISRQRLDELIRLFAKSYVAHLKSKRMAEAVLASTKMENVKKIRSGFTQAASKTIENIEAVSEVLLTHVEEKLIPAAEKGNKFKPGRSKGAITKATIHIKDLAKNNRSLSAKQLFSKANKSIIGNMDEGTFGNHLSDARKLYPKEKKARKK